MPWRARGHDSAFGESHWFSSSRENCADWWYCIVLVPPNWKLRRRRRNHGGGSRVATAWSFIYRGISGVNRFRSRGLFMPRLLHFSVKYIFLFFKNTISNQSFIALQLNEAVFYSFFLWGIWWLSELSSFHFLDCVSACIFWAKYTVPR